MQYHHIQNYTIITFYTYHGIQILRRRSVPHLRFRKVLLVNSLQSGKVWQACTPQTEKSHSHTNSAVSHQVYVHALLVQHLQSVFFQHMVWYGPTSATVIGVARAETKGPFPTKFLENIVILVL